MSDYPQHDKIKAAHESPQGTVLGDFIDFLTQKGVVFGEWPKPCPYDPDDEDYEGEECHQQHTRDGYHVADETLNGNRLFPMNVGPEGYSRWIAEFYGVDHKAFLDEKEALYRELVAGART